MAKAAIDYADIVVTTIPLLPATTPFLDARWLKAGSFTTMTDLALPWMAETMARFDRIVIDDLAQEAEMKTPMIKPELFRDLLRADRGADLPEKPTSFQKLALPGGFVAGKPRQLSPLDMKEGLVALRTRHLEPSAGFDECSFDL